MNNSNDLNINNKYKVLFVCLGNICRSPAAHGIFEHIVRREGAQDMVEVDSAGTYGKHRGGNFLTGECVRQHLPEAIL